MSWSWIFAMAWRDSRSNRRKLFLYMGAIIVGIVAQVAIMSFRENLNESINNQARELLGADLQVQRSAPLQPEVVAYLDSLSPNQARMIEFNSMAYFPRNGATRLSQIMAMEPEFPFYGTLKTDPKEAINFRTESNDAYIDNRIMLQLDIRVGDSVKIGLNTYQILGGIIDIPGQSMAASFLGPRIILPFDGIETSGLLERGSRLLYTTFVKYPPNVNAKVVVEELEAIRDTLSFGFDDVAERQNEIGEAVNYLSNFLNLVGFIALLLGGIGIASSIFVYVRQKTSTIAILRCLGVSSNQALFIYLIQALFMGFIGSLFGAFLGSLVQLYLPVLVQDFIPVEIELFISWSSILLGLLTGIIISTIFALIPLLAVKKIPPLFTLRTAHIKLLQLLGNATKSLLTLFLIFGIVGYTWLMLQDMLTAIYFTVGLGVCLLILTAISVLIMYLARIFIPSSWAYEWRQGLANLYRPNNQTTILLLTYGLGVTLSSSLYLTQDLLLGTINFEGEDELPNLAMFDIQYDQNDGVNEIITNYGLEVMQNVPIVTMRLQSLQGRTTQEILNDTNRVAKRWALNREYRSTYRDTLIETETLLGGEFIGSVYTLDDAVPISIEIELMKDLGASIGDTLIWNVQGMPIKSFISSTREVNWQTPEPNFFVVFPKGVLEPAPQFFATTVNTPNQDISLSLQREIVVAYPNVSAIDVSQITDTIRDFLDRITFVIQFIGLFGIVTGLIVLAGSTATSRFQRIRESILLRTLGAVKKQVVKIQIIEYLFLGILATFTGLFLSVGASTLIGIFFFNIHVVPNVIMLAIQALLLIGFVVLIGFINTQGIHSKAPLEVLRHE